MPRRKLKRNTSLKQHRTPKKYLTHSNKPANQASNLPSMCCNYTSKCKDGYATVIYDFMTCIVLCLDWFFSFVTMYDLYQLQNSKYLIFSLIIICISRLIVCQRSQLVLYSPMIICSCSPYFYFQHLHNCYFGNKFQIKRKKIEKCKYSTFQLWIQHRIDIHRIHGLSHCITQSFPQLILLFVMLLLNKQITYYQHPMIYISFFISLLSIIICSPIYFQSFYYWLASNHWEELRIDHYDLSTFIFNTLAFLLDFILLLCIIGYCTQYNSLLITRLWYFQFWIIVIIAAITGIIVFVAGWKHIYTPDVRPCTRHIKRFLNKLIKFPVYEWIRIGCNEGFYVYSTCSFGILWRFLLFIGWLIITTVAGEIIVFLWIPWLTITYLARYNGDIVISEKLMFWLKNYNNVNDLKIRLCCINRGLSRFPVEPKCAPIEILMNQCNDYNDITFGDIRQYSDLKSKSLCGILRSYCNGMSISTEPSIILSLIVGAFVYFFAKIALVLIPIIGLIQNYNDRDNLIVILSWIYCVLLFSAVALLYGVFLHLWIFAHIAPGTFHFRIDYKTFKMIKKSYLNVKRNIRYQKQEKIAALKIYFDNDIVSIILHYVAEDFVFSIEQDL